MKHDKLEVVESTNYSEEYPHRISVFVHFKSMSKREEFKRKVKKILEDED